MDDNLTKARVLILDDDTCLGLAEDLDLDDGNREFLLFEQNHCYNKKGNEIDMDDVKVGKTVYLDEILVSFPESFVKKIALLFK